MSAPITAPLSVLLKIIDTRMQTGFSLLSSKIARRFLLLFLLCAFLPTTVLVGFSYLRVKAQLVEQSWLRMDKESKNYAMGILDRLTHMDTLVRLCAAFLADRQQATAPPEHLLRQISTNFSGLGLYRPGAGIAVLSGHLDEAATLADECERVRSQSGKTTLLLGRSEMLPKPVYLLVPFGDTPGTGILVARPEESLLWGIGVHSVLPSMTDMAIYDEQGKLIAATLSSPGTEMPSHTSRSSGGNFLQFEYTLDNQTYLASGWSLFLKSHFDASTWTVLLSASAGDVLGAMLEFKHTVPLMMALGLWIILFLAFFFIRRTLSPLALLQEGTKRVGARDFNSRVEIASGDEFEQLAESFNTMSGQLQKQFHTLALIDEIDRSILSTLDPSIIIPRSLRLTAELFASPFIMLVQCTPAEPNLARLTSIKGSHRNDIVHEHARLDDADLDTLFNGEPYSLLAAEADRPAFLSKDACAQALLCLPMEVERRVKGVLLLAFSLARHEISQEEIAQARQIASQIAVALANAQLVHDLEQLSIGTVEALARTVDAKSRWTAGHSERVADLAVRIGRVLHCHDHLLEQLFRGGLLHDIGKIGIPISILDKPGKLDAEEYAAITTHPAMGGKILEPIQAYQDVVPIIVQHHERYDGKGYPQKLAGEAISFGARILCVADVYDALISNRPYRQGWVKEEALNFMRENRGSMFDPSVVDAFLTLES